MNFFEKLENYFNSGSTDKQNKRRLGGLLIGITAILLVIAILVTAIGGLVALIGGIEWGGGQDESDDGAAGNSHLSEETMTLDQIKAEATGGIVLDDTVLQSPTLTMMSPDQRAYTSADNTYDSNARNYIYGCVNWSTYHMNSEALTAFNAMMRAFYLAEQKTHIYIVNAYVKDSTNVGHFANGLAVQINYADEDWNNLGSIYGVDDYKWIYENADKYGFVRVSNAEGQENIFRYVGLAHAKYIYSQQKKNSETFYTIDSYLTEIKATTPDTKMSAKGYKSLEDDGTMTYYTYYMTATEGQVYKLPNDSYDYTVTATSDGGYIVTYWKAAKQ